MSGLHEPVSVVRDAYGIPHITATNADDLFFAQGFVQAQDRLFQMDLWKRSVQGRLSEVLGANFIQRDSMTRRIQYRGDLDREWTSYGPDTRPIALAFTNGINAWVHLARAELPEEFRAAGWVPEFWRPEDLLNRTDAFLASGGAADELFRARLVAALGASRVDALLPLPDGRRTVVPKGVDFSAITYVVPEALQRIGTPPFFLTLATPVSTSPRPGRQAVQVQAEPNGAAGVSRDTVLQGARLQPGLAGRGAAWVLGPSRSATGGPLLAVAPRRRFDNPSLRYLVHLSAPGWNVAGATAPWLPGVAIGHNERIAWGMTTAGDDTEDIFVERVNPNNPHQVEHDSRWVDLVVDHERVDVKGRPQPVEYERLYTPNGVVIAQDRERGLVYTLRWSGTEPGGAAELAALAIDRASNWSEFRQALSHWHTPPAHFVYADIDGHVAEQRAGLVPIRSSSAGVVPAAGGSGSRGWVGFTDLSATPGDLDSGTRSVIAADSAPRAAYLATALAKPVWQGTDDMRRLQGDVVAWNASTLIPLLDNVRSANALVRPLEARLRRWDRRVGADSPGGALYVRWEWTIRRFLAERNVPAEFVDEFASRLDPVLALTRPSSVWFSGDAFRARDTLLATALIEAGKSALEARTVQEGANGWRGALMFAHPLAVFDSARQRFNVGPFSLAGYSDTVFATDGSSGPTFQAVFDPSDWNAAVVTNPPGQSGSPASPHYDDLASKWAAGDYVNLLFDQEQIASSVGDTLTLLPVDPKSSNNQIVKVQWRRRLP